MKLFKWDAVTDYDLAGYRLKASSYLDASWEQCTSLTDQLIRRTDYETGQLPKGTYKIFLKSVDRSGNESSGSSSATVVVAPAASTYKAAYDAYADSWASGTLSSGTLNVTENIIEPDTTTRTNFVPWSDWSTWDEYSDFLSMQDATTAWSAWLRWNTMVTWGTAAPALADPIVYEIEIDSLDTTSYRPLIFCQAIGTQHVELATSTDGVSWGSYADYATQELSDRYIKVRVTISGPEPLLTGLNIQLTKI